MQAFSKPVITPQHPSGQISSFTHSSSTSLVPRRRPTPLICPAWKQECCWWCPFGASLAWGWGRDAGASSAPLGWFRDWGSARDTASSLAEGGCSPGDAEPWWCSTVLSDGLQPVSAAAHRWRQAGWNAVPSVARLKASPPSDHLPLLPACASLPRSGTPRHSWPAAQRVRAPASPSGNFLSSSASVLGPRAISAQHHCALVAFTELYFSSDG